MADIELRDPDEARRFIAHGLCLARSTGLVGAAVASGLEWTLALAAEGWPLPPAGFVFDLGYIALGQDREPKVAPRHGTPHELAGLLRAYEDHVLGKLYGDSSFARAADVIRRLTPRDRPRGVAFVVHQYRIRADVSGALLSPTVIKSLAEWPADELVRRGDEEIAARGLDPVVADLLRRLVSASRLSGDVLGPDDIFELERGTALAELSQRVALRQVVRVAAAFSAAVPRQPPTARAERREVPTQVRDEDVYPVGGFASVSNRGGIESLLHSQLAYMETAVGAARPDLFDIKFVRDELLYYSRDENQFLRRRRAYAIVFEPSLQKARFKDPGLPYQRVILALGWVVTLVRTMANWLSHDALTFRLSVPIGGPSNPLAAETELLTLAFHDEVETGQVAIESTQVAGLRDFVEPTLRIGVGLGESGDRLDLSAPDPRLSITGNDLRADDKKEPWDAWTQSLNEILAEWS